MFALFNNILDLLKRSLWFIPLIMTFFGLSLGLGLNYLDSILWQTETPIRSNFEGVIPLFSTVGAAIITSMTTILSITLLIFTVLAGQYGSHVLRVFKVRTFSKFVIGWFSGVYVYIVSQIYVITLNDQEVYNPQLSITIGVILTVSTIFLLIIYIHFLVRQIQVGTVISEVSDELSKLIRSLKDWDSSADDDLEGAKVYLPEKTGDFAHKFSHNCSGYVQSIDKESLAHIAKENEFVIKVMHRQGEFVVTGEPTFIVYSNNEIEDDIVSKIKNRWIFGEKRIPVEDLEYYLEMMLEMIFRALSPGVNNTILANSCIDYLGESMALLVKRQFPKNRTYSEDKKLLLMSKEFSFEGYLNCALNPLRQYSSGNCFVTLKVMDNLIKVIKICESEKYGEFIKNHFMAIHKSSLDQQMNSIDKESVEKRLKLFLEYSKKSNRFK